MLPTPLPELHRAEPANQIHLLLWDAPRDLELNKLASYVNGDRLSYRDDLLQRLDSGSKFLNLDAYLDRELAALKAMCDRTTRPLILLEDFDWLLTYLRVRPSGGNLKLLWSNLQQTRKLPCRLWIVLPPALAPKDWPAQRRLAFA
ncbi:MAG: hypothetical protein HC910_04030 [Spirulinaceae cyanobacterium SM2_1_0]|nr:hypothetical protein [Spirulinaceae cyanobacterium SM2_1_0]